MPCDDLDREIDRYRAAGFQLDAIGPADSPHWAELTMPGLSVVLDAGDDRPAGPRLRVSGRPAPRPGDGAGDGDGAPLPALVDQVGSDDRHRMVVPPARPALAVSHEADGSWVVGRAGMRYRDLVPHRLGGAYIASHIHIARGGPVPDYVHHHDIAYQLIFCHRGWVRVVYQDQGPPFVLHPGDLVLQPPGIRHQVLEASDDLYVAELTCPAVHRTSLDHALPLPTATIEPHRRYGRQRFVHHVTADGVWTRRRNTPFESQDTGVSLATGGLVSARLLRCDEPWAWPLPLSPEHDLHFLFVAEGGAALVTPDGAVERLGPGSSAAIPPGGGHALDDLAAGTLLLEVTSTVKPSA